MSNDNRVPAGVPTGGEFATGARAENDDLDAGIVNVGLLLQTTHLSVDDADQAVAFSNGDRAQAIEILMEQQEIVDDHANMGLDKTVAYKLSTEVVRDAKGDMVEARRLYTRRARAKLAEQAANRYWFEGREKMQAASALQARAIVEKILELHPDASKVMLFGDTDGSRQWVAITPSGRKTITTHALGMDDFMVDVYDPESLNSLCVGYGEGEGRGQARGLQTLGSERLLRSAEFNLAQFGIPQGDPR